MAGALQVWSPFREMDRFRREIDDLFDRFMNGGAFGPQWVPTTWAPAVESYVEGENLVIRADLPGIDPKNVEVTVTGNTLTVRGSRESRHEENERDYMYREVAYGSFERSLTLPASVTADQVKAAYNNGVLELTMPAPRELAAKKIPIQIENKK
jgi:HSP20 family protein